MINQTVLPFKLEQTKDLITAHAGLALVGEFTIDLGVLEALDKSLPAPGSGAGYRARDTATDGYVLRGHAILSGALF